MSLEQPSSSNFYNPPQHPHASLDHSKSITLSRHLLSYPQQFGYRLTEGVQQEILKHLFSQFWSTNEEYRSLFFPHGFGEGPDAYKLSLAQGVESVEYSLYQKGKACGHVFKKGEGVYRCRNCALDDTCVFCSRCYHATNHEGHDITFSVNGSGGCCDCGDPEAWKLPIDCAYHSPDPTVAELLECEKKEFEKQLPQDLIDSIHDTISTVLDFMLDILSSSPEDMTPPSSTDEVKQELETGSAIRGALCDEKEEKLFAVILWNDEHHSFSEVIDQVKDATGCTELQAKSIAERVDSYGRDIVEVSEDITRLLRIARAISAIGLAVTIRSARDTFLEEMCGLLIDWLKDLAKGKLGSHPTLLRDIICEELCKEYRKPLHAKRGARIAGKLKQHDANIDDTRQEDWMSDDDVMVQVEDDYDDDVQVDEEEEIHDLKKFRDSSGDYAMIVEDELFVTTDPMDEDETMQHLQLVDDFRKKLRLDKLLSLDLRLWKEARASLKELYIGTLVINSEYKKMIGIRFARNYIRLADAFLSQDREPEHSIILFSVQLFTVPTIATILVTRYNFLATIFSILHTFFTSNQVGGYANIDPLAKINCDSDAFKNRRYFHIFYDLRYIISTEAVKKAISRSQNHLHAYLDLIILFQGMNPNVRATQQHVEYETDSWVNAFNVTLQLAKSCRQFSECFVYTPKTLGLTIRHVLKRLYEWSARHDAEEEDEGEKMDETSDGPQGEEATRSRRLTEDLLPTFKGQEFHEVVFPSNPYLTSFKVVKFKVASQPVSFHHPLHWFLAELLENIELLDDEVLKQHGWDSFQSMMMGFDVGYNELDVFDRAKEKILEILDYPLRVLVLLVQIRAGLWVRNGFGIRGQCHHYREVSLRENTYDEDLFLIQTAFVLLEPNLVLATILDRFDMVEWFCGKKSHNTYDNSQLIFVAEELLALLIICVGERGSAAGLTIEQEIKREIIHGLCFAPIAYSELTKRIPERLTEEASFDEILSKLAIYRPPDSLTDNGLYELRDEYFDEVDPYFVHYSRNNREEAEETLKNRLKRKMDSVGEQTTPLIIPKLTLITNGPYVRLGNLLHTRLMNQILFYSLWHIKNDKIKSDTLVDEALHLVMLALLDENNDVVKGNKRKGKQKATDSQTPEVVDDGMPGFMHYAVNDFFPVEINKFCPEGTNLLNLLLQLSIDSTFKEFQPKFDFIINEFETLGSDSAKKTINKHRERIRAELNAKTGEKESMSEYDRKKQAAKERQAKIMEQFAKAQQNFIEKHEDLYEEDEEMDEDWELAVGEDHLGADGSIKTEAMWSYPTGTCIVCQEETSSSALYGMLGLIQPSNMLRHTPFEDKDYVKEVFDLPENLDRKCDRSQPSRVASSMDPENLSPLLSKGFPTKICRAGVYASTCGHLMHVKCFKTYFSSLEQRHQLQLARNHPEDVKRKEFMCPLCKSLGNALLPILWKGKKEAFPGVLKPKDTFEKWLNEVGPMLDQLFTTALSGLSNSPEVTRRQAFSSENAANDLREFTHSRSLPNPSPTTPRRRNSSNAGRIRDVLVQFYELLTSNGQESDTTANSSTRVEASALSEDEDHESIREMYDRFAEVVKMAYLLVNPLFRNESVDPLWDLFGYTISCVEISQRGVGSVTNEGLPSATLLDGISTQTLTLLRILSETILKYTNTILDSRSGELKHAQRFQQLFYWHHYQSLQSTATPLNFEFSSSLPFTNLKPLLLEDCFMFLAELCVHSPACDVKFEIHHLMHLMFFAEFVKVVIAIGEAGMNENTKSWLEDERVNASNFSCNQQRGSNKLKDFVIWILPKVGNTERDITEFFGKINEIVLWKFARTFCLPFLRKCVLLLYARFGVVFPKPGLEVLEADDNDEFERLSRLLRLPSIEEMCAAFVGNNIDASLVSIVTGWCHHLRAKRTESARTNPGGGFTNASTSNPSVYRVSLTNTDTNSASSSASSLSSLQSQLFQFPHSQKMTLHINHPAIFELVGLPKQLDSLFEASLRKVCPKCKTIPHDPALCLLCGTFVCSQSYCCSEYDRGECNIHARSCGGDIGIYLLVKKCVILLLHLENGCFMNAPYLDVHGEVDLGLKRGCPQYLNFKRYDEIRKLWLTHSVPIHVARKIEQTFDLGGWSTM